MESLQLHCDVKLIRREVSKKPIHGTKKNTLPYVDKEEKMGSPLLDGTFLESLLVFYLAVAFHLTF